MVASIAAEWLPGGGIRPWSRIDPMRLITPLTKSGVFIYACKYILTIQVLETFNRTFGNGYMKLQQVALIDEFYGYHLGLLIFAANIKLLKILEFNHKMSLLIYTLSRCWGDLSSFLGIFFLAFFSFVQMFYLILYSDLDDFKSPTRALNTCFTMMLNKFKFGTIKVTMNNHNNSKKYLSIFRKQTPLPLLHFFSLLFVSAGSLLMFFSLLSLMAMRQSRWNLKEKLLNI